MDQIITNGYDADSDMVRLFMLPESASKDIGNLHQISPNQLDEYLDEYRQKKKFVQKRNQYNEVAIMAKIDRWTTEEELDRLLNSDVRTLLVQKHCNKPADMQQIFLKISNCIAKFYMQNIFRTPVGVAIEVNGELLITGRMRNERNVYVERGQIIVLSNNIEYKYCCFKEVVYVCNLWRYTEVIQLGDVIFLGERNDIMTQVVKAAPMQPITVRVTRAGCLKSYMPCKVPHFVEAKGITDKDKADLDEAMTYEPQFLVLPGVRGLNYLKAVKEHVGEGIIYLATVDFDYLENKFVDCADILMELDGVIFQRALNPSDQVAKAMNECVSQKKVIIGGIQLESCKDLKKLQNHQRIQQLDCLMIQKSLIRKQFPLIAKKLLPIGNPKLDLPRCETVTCKEGIVNFVLRTIYTIPCQGLIITNACPKAAEAFSIIQIYCPVIVVVECDRMARLLNLRKNMKTVICNEKSLAMDVGIEFGRLKRFFTTGDFIICISDEEVNNNVCVNIRAYYLPPLNENLDLI